ncbi:MAG: hypothetical protein O9322_17010 [Beijerinckiaceae bacterium]|nr:hypothetical protein [Beijerinckiaceae bacterium]MCZ8301053.1 hypothetical protein [Beijerinckiaceae bacterium]
MARRWIMRTMLVALLPLGLAACQSSMTAMAPATGVSRSATPLAFVAVQGPAPDLARQFESILAQEARKRGFEVVSPATPGNALRVKTYLDAYQAADGKAGFSWVLDTSENGQTRANRVRGAAALGTASSTPWASLDETAMRQIAQMSLDDLARLSAGDAAATTVASTGGTTESE